MSHRKVAVQLERFNKQKEALSHYKKAYQLCEEKFGSQDRWTKRFFQNYKNKLREIEGLLVPDQIADELYDNEDSVFSNNGGSQRGGHHLILPRDQLRPEWQKTDNPYAKRPHSSKIHKQNCNITQKYSQPQPKITKKHPFLVKKSKNNFIIKKKKKNELRSPKNIEVYEGLQIEPEEVEGGNNPHRLEDMGEVNENNLKELAENVEREQIKKRALDEKDKIEKQLREEALSKKRDLYLQEQQDQMEALLKQQAKKTALQNTYNDKLAELIKDPCFIQTFEQNIDTQLHHILMFSTQEKIIFKVLLFPNTDEVILKWRDVALQDLAEGSESRKIKAYNITQTLLKHFKYDIKDNLCIQKKNFYQHQIKMANDYDTADQKFPQENVLSEDQIKQEVSNQLEKKFIEKEKKMESKYNQLRDKDLKKMEDQKKKFEERVQNKLDQYIKEIEAGKNKLEKLKNEKNEILNSKKNNVKESNPYLKDEEPSSNGIDIKPEENQEANDDNENEMLMESMEGIALDSSDVIETFQKSDLEDLQEKAFANQSAMDMNTIAEEDTDEVGSSNLDGGIQSQLSPDMTPKFDSGVQNQGFENPEKVITEEGELIFQSKCKFNEKNYNLKGYRNQSHQNICIVVVSENEGNRHVQIIPYEDVNLKEGTPNSSVKQHFDKVFCSNLDIDKNKNRLNFTPRGNLRRFQWTESDFGYDGTVLDSEMANFDDGPLDQESDSHYEESLNEEQNEVEQQPEDEEFSQDQGSVKHVEEEDRPELDKDEDSSEDLGFESQVNNGEKGIQEEESIEDENQKISEESKDTEQTSGSLEDAWKAVSQKIVDTKLGWAAIFERLSDPHHDYIICTNLINYLHRQLTVPQKQAIQVVRDIDYDQNGMIPVEEWLDMAEQFMDSVKDHRNLHLSFEETKYILYNRLLDGEVNWQGLFTMENENLEDIATLSLAKTLEDYLELPQRNLFQFIKHIDYSGDGFISFEEWMDAKNLAIFKDDPHKNLLGFPEEEHIPTQQQAPTFVYKADDFDFSDHEMDRSSTEEENEKIEDLNESGKALDTLDPTKDKKKSNEKTQKFDIFVAKDNYFNPESFFDRISNRHPSNKNRKQAKKAFTIELINDFNEEHPEVDNADLLARLKEWDEEQTGLIDKELWLDAVYGGQEEVRIPFEEFLANNPHFDSESLYNNSSNETKYLNFEGEEVVPVFNLVKNFQEQYEEVDIPTLVQRLHKYDPMDSGFMTKLTWLNVCQENITKIHYIKDQNFDKETYQLRNSRSLTTLRSVVGDDSKQKLLSCYIHSDVNHKLIVASSILANEISKQYREISEQKIFEALCKIDSQNTLTVNFFEFCLAFQINKSDLPANLHYTTHYSIDTIYYALHTMLTPMIEAKQVFMDSNFDFRGAFEDNVWEVKQKIRVASSIYLAREIVSHTQHKDYINPLFLVLDAPEEGFIEEFVWREYFFPTFVHTVPSKSHNFESWKTVALEKIQESDNLKTVYKRMKTANDKSRAGLTKLEIAFLAFQKMFTSSDHIAMLIKQIADQSPKDEASEQQSDKKSPKESIRSNNTKNTPPKESNREELLDHIPNVQEVESQIIPVEKDGNVVKEIVDDEILEEAEEEEAMVPSELDNMDLDLGGGKDSEGGAEISGGDFGFGGLDGPKSEEKPMLDDGGEEGSNQLDFDDAELGDLLKNGGDDNIDDISGDFDFDDEL